MMFPRPVTYRSPAIRAEAKHHGCQLLVAGLVGLSCKGQSTVVFCHGIEANRGTGDKCDDFWGAFGCQQCHDLMDGRDGRLSEVQRLRGWLRGTHRTQRILFERGLLVIRDERIA